MNEFVGGATVGVAGLGSTRGAKGAAGVGAAGFGGAICADPGTAGLDGGTNGLGAAATGFGARGTAGVAGATTATTFLAVAVVIALLAAGLRAGVFWSVPAAPAAGSALNAAGNDTVVSRRGDTRFWPGRATAMATRSLASILPAAAWHFASFGKSRNTVLPAPPPATEPLNITVTNIKVHMHRSGSARMVR